MTFMANLPMVVSSINYVRPDVDELKHYLEFRRFEGSGTQREFCKKHLRPVMGRPDSFGNYTLIIGDKPRVAFMAHHDTVHILEGHQRILEQGAFVHLPSSSRSNCLGADCTTGVWLILHMIKCGVEGVYVVHAAEEIGGKGADFIVKNRPDWMEHVEVAVSFDRKGYDSVITHQAGMRTASDTFARALSKELGGQFKPDSTGIFTDSQVYCGDISECTNLSVGYFNQHTRAEKQDLPFAYELAEALVNVNWKDLPAIRDPYVFESSYVFGKSWKTPTTTYTPSQLKNMDVDDYIRQSETRNKAEAMEQIVRENPYLIAKLLVEFGMTKEALIDELGLWENNYEW